MFVRKKLNTKFPALLSTVQLAALIGISPTQVSRLATAKIIPKASRGAFPAEAALRAAFAYYRTTAKVTGTQYAEERVALVIAQRRDIEERTAQRSHNLIDYEEHASTVLTLCQTYNAQLDGMAGRLTPVILVAVAETKPNPALIRKVIHDETQRIRISVAKAFEAGAAQHSAPSRQDDPTIRRRNRRGLG